MTRIVSIHYLLGNKKESLQDLCKENPDWSYEKLLSKTNNDLIITTGRIESKLLLFLISKFISILKKNFKKAILLTVAFIGLIYFLDDNSSINFFSPSFS